MLGRALGSIGARPQEDPAAFEDAAYEAIRTFPFQPLSLRADLKSLAEPRGPPCLHLSGLPVGALTEDGPARGATADAIPEAVVFGIARMLGTRAFAFEGHCGEELVRTWLHEGDEAFGWHRGGRCAPAYMPPRRVFRPEAEIADFTTTLCLRADRPLFVHFVDFRVLCAETPAQDLELLRASPLAFFDRLTGQRSEPILVVSACGDDPDASVVDLRQVDRFEAEGHQEAVAAYQRLTVTAEKARQTIELSQGHLAVFNNRRCLQMWTSPEAAADAWVQTIHSRRDDGGEFARVRK